MTKTSFGYPIERIDCSKQGFPEVPDMLFGEDSEGVPFFDATALLIKRDLPRILTTTFLKTHVRTIDAMKQAMSIRHTCIMNEADSHICLHGHLKFLFLCYIDPDFLAYIHQKLIGLFEDGMVFSDTYVAQLAYTHLTPEVLKELADGDSQEQE